MTRSELINIVNTAIDFIYIEVDYLEDAFQDNKCTPDEFCNRVWKNYKKHGHTSNFERKVMETVLEETGFRPIDGLLYGERDVKIPERDACIEKYEQRRNNYELE